MVLSTKNLKLNWKYKQKIKILNWPRRAVWNISPPRVSPRFWKEDVLDAIILVCLLLGDVLEEGVETEEIDLTMTKLMSVTSTNQMRVLPSYSWQRTARHRSSWGRGWRGAWSGYWPRWWRSPASESGSPWSGPGQWNFFVFCIFVNNYTGKFPNPLLFGLC